MASLLPGASRPAQERDQSDASGLSQTFQAPARASSVVATSVQSPGSNGSAGAQGEVAAPGAEVGSESATATAGGAPASGAVAEELPALAGALGAGESSGAETAAPLLGYGVGLQQAIEAVNASIELAARGGLAQARIALEPEELGEIRIHLTQTTSGLVARVTAENPAAAQALAAGHAELRQSLSSAGLSLTRLHIGHGQMAAGTGEGSAGGREGAGAPGTHRRGPVPRRRVPAPARRSRTVARGRAGRTGRAQPACQRGPRRCPGLATVRPSHSERGAGNEHRSVGDRCGRLQFNECEGLEREARARLKIRRPNLARTTSFS